MIRKLLMGLILIPVLAQAQTRTINGKVKGADDGLEVPGASVLVQGTTRGVATDVEGNFKIDLQPGENVLVISFVGYKTQNVTVGDRAYVEVLLESDVTSLDEVVVIGYGVVKKSDLTGSVSSIKERELNTVPAINPMQSLQGKIAGVQVANVSGAPGSSTYVRIRGIGTFNDSSPIFVVD